MPRRNLFAIAAVGAMSMLCWQATQGAKPKDETMELYGLFVDAVEQVQANYVRPVSRKDLLESALKGMLQDLDPHSNFLNTSHYKSFKRSIEGRFGGVGITVGYDNEVNRLKVLAPMVGTPAYAAGIMAGDLIMEIEGKSTEGMSTDKAVDALQGQPGQPVKLTILHEGSAKPEVITVKRAIIEVPTVVSDLRKLNDTPDFMIDKDKKIGYIRITEFHSNTAAEVKAAVEELKTQGVKGLILDLRGDPGGLLTAAVEISDLFLEKGVIVSTRGRNTIERVYEAQKEGTFADIPMAVLVNENSASASEILSAALQDHKRAVVVGQRSYGKGSVQNLIDLEDGNSVLKLTVATYWRPSGKNIHRFKDAKETDDWGVSPDKGFEVKLSTQEHFAWAIGRRDRDLMSGKAAATLLAKEAEEKAGKKDVRKEEKKDEKKPETAEAKPATKPAARQPRPFKDRQLDKALEYVRGKIG
jgi:carboxyl-terminal processing protease